MRRLFRVYSSYSTSLAAGARLAAPRGSSAMAGEHSSADVGLAFGLVIMAGLSTAIGSAFVFCSARADTGVLARALGASAGVMIYVSFAEIYCVKSVEAFTEVCGSDGNCGWRYASLCFFGGLIFMYGLDFVVHKANDGGCFGGGKAAFDVAKSKDRHGARVKHAHDHSFLSIHGELDGCVRDIAEMESGVTRVHVCAASKATDESQSSSSSVSDTTTTPPDDVTISNVDLTDVHHKAIEAKTLKNMGVMTAIAIGLHNFPEGLATFVAALADPKLGAALAIAIAIHNVPEGICVAMPIYYATGSKWKGFWWSFLSGLSEPIGAVFGYAILNGNDMSPAAFGSLFGLVAGMMVFISVKELIPTALKYDPHDEYVTTYVFVGMAIMAASLILFYL